MIKHEMKTRREHVTAFYRTVDHQKKALEGPYPSMKVVQLAHVVYDHNQQQFTKCRDTGNTELLNALLTVRRNQNRITDEMRDCVTLVMLQEGSND